MSHLLGEDAPSPMHYQSFRDIQLNNASNSPSKKGFFAKVKDEAKKLGEQSGPQCFSCNAPWIEENRFLHGRHSRNCSECGVSFCADCKFDNMIKTNNVSRNNFEREFIHNKIASHSGRGGGGSGGSRGGKTWLCRDCAKDYELPIGSACTACNAPWITRNSFLGANSQHSRACYSCGVAYCHQCKHDFMLKESATKAIRRSVSKRKNSEPISLLDKSLSKQCINQASAINANNKVDDDDNVNINDVSDRNRSQSMHDQNRFYRYECFKCRDLRKGNSSHHISAQQINSENHQSLTLSSSSSSSSSSSLSGQMLNEDLKDIKQTIVTLINKEALGIDTNDQLMIIKVIPGSAADRVGLQVGWTILELNGIRVLTVQSAENVLSHLLEKVVQDNLTHGSVQVLSMTLSTGD